MRKDKLIVIICLTALSLTGCFEEDYSMCRPEGNNVKLNFLLPGDNGECTFLSDITTVTTSVFDADGVYVGAFRTTEAEHAIFKGIYLNLPPGQYKAICWANSNGNTMLRQPEQCYTQPGSTICYNTAGAETVGNCDPVYYGPNSVVTRAGNPQGEYEFTVTNQGYEGTIEFRHAHRIIEVYVKGYQENGVTTPRVQLSGLPSALSFLGMKRLESEPTVNSVIGSNTITVTEDGVDNIYSLARFHVFYFRASDYDIGIDIVSPSTGESIFHTTLNEWIDPANDDPETAITLRLKVEFKGINAEVSVPGWNSGDVDWGFN